MEQGWHTNTDLGCDVKTILRNDRKMKVAKEYQGVLKLDSDAVIDEFLCRDSHYTFTETLSSTAERRNVHLYEGTHITCTKRLNGSLRLNFKNLKMGAGFSIDAYAFEVANEIREALDGLIENK